MLDKHLKFLNVAKRLCTKTLDMKRQFGCLIVDGNKIVALGWNKRSHSKTPKLISHITGKKYWGLHAEIHALLKCDFSVVGTTIYVHGQNVKTGNYVYSKPCELCQHILKKRGITRSIFSTPFGYEVCNYFV